MDTPKFTKTDFQSITENIEGMNKILERIPRNGRKQIVKDKDFFISCHARFRITMRILNKEEKDRVVLDPFHYFAGCIGELQHARLCWRDVFNHLPLYYKPLYFGLDVTIKKNLSYFIQVLGSHMKEYVNHANTKTRKRKSKGNLVR